jgi:hypothetical protein
MSKTKPAVLPSSGGSFHRAKDGSLTRREEPAPKPAKPPVKPPVKPTKKDG